MTSGSGRTMLLALALAAVAAGAGAGVADAADPATRRYVIEQLVVSVSAEPGGGDRVAQIKSGDAVDLIERQGEVARVRLASGTEGWVKASYLSAELPLRERLAGRERELDELRAKLAAPVAKVPVATAPAAAQPGMSAQSDAPLDPPIHSTAAAPAAPATPTSWQGILGAGCAGLALGFLIGWRALDRRIRARYGGLKIY